MSLTWDYGDYEAGIETITHAKRYLDERGRLDFDAEGVLLQAARDILDAITAQRAMQYLSTKPVEPNEHNLHSAAKVAAGLLILMMLAGVSWLFWLKASQ